MDVSVVGRERVEEQAILEELAGPEKSVRGGDRRWMLAIAGIAAIVCMGFAGDLVWPTPHEPARMLPNDDPLAPNKPSAGPDDAPALAVDVTRGKAGVTGALVPVQVRAAPNDRVHLAITVGTAVVGWRDVKVGADGSWQGEVQVFAPRVALPAAVHASTSTGSAAVEASDPFTLGGGSPILVWKASVVTGRRGAMTVAYRASGPLTFTRIDAWVSDGRGRRLGASRTASRVNEWQAGSAGARELGIASIVDVISIRGKPRGGLVLTIAWRDASTASTGTLVVPLESAGSAQPD
ncbi:MAG TPA: hypothetical protein VIZ22_04365 [Candidatus Limnocylindrales bacterium]